MGTPIDRMCKRLGFRSAEDFRQYMKERAQPGEYGGMNYNETRRGYDLNYSDNCVHPYGISGRVKGTYREARFN